MNAAMPDSNPINLCVREGRLHTDSYTIACSSTPPKRFASKTGIGESEFKSRISMAAEVLRPFLVSEEKLEQLVLFIEDTLLL
jgi:hypothetical protein